MNEPKFKIGETVVITESRDLKNVEGKLAVIEKHFRPVTREFSEHHKDYLVEIEGVGRTYANVREATEMDKALEGL